MSSIDSGAPTYRHDCPRCTYRGTIDGHDIYTCEQGAEMPTVVARYGSPGPGYISGRKIRFGDLVLERAGTTGKELA